MRSPHADVLRIPAALAVVLGLSLACGLARAQERNLACVAGFAGIYACSNVDLLAHMPLSGVGGLAAGSGSEIWGWTDPTTMREYALVGLNNGTAFVDVTVPTAPVYLGKLPTATSNSSWRSLRVYQNYVFVGSEASSHGVQVFDLTRLRGVTTPQTFTADARYTGNGKSHTLGLNEATGFMYLAGANQSGFACNGGGLHMVNIQNPLTPVFAGCYDADGYTHENQCIVYDGPDPDYVGREICVAYNVDHIAFVDVTNKTSPTLISSAFYPQTGYTHQGWFDEDRQFIFVDDELDELNGAAATARTIVMNAANLDNTTYVGSFLSPTASSDHNQYVRGEYLYQSNYRAGLRLLHIDNSATAAFTQVGFFDTYPAANTVNAGSGQWMNYPYFASGIVVASDINNGFFVLRPTTVVVAGEAAPLPAGGFSLTAPTPNPASDVSRFTLSVAEPQHVRAEAFDALGRRVAVVFDGSVADGTPTTLVLDAAALPAGPYLLRLTGETFATTARVSVAH